MCGYDDPRDERNLAGLRHHTAVLQYRGIRYLRHEWWCVLSFTCFDWVEYKTLKEALQLQDDDDDDDDE